MPLTTEEHVPLAPLTTIKLGGSARYFVNCRTVAELREAVQYAKKHALPLHVLGGGSNTVFADTGFNGLVLKIDIRGIEWAEDGRVKVGAGEEWDPFVQACVRRGWAGVECLSGIPGLAGATPIQNVGAYGQEIADTLVEVSVFDSERGEEKVFRKEELDFAYRTSRFKRGPDAGRYIVTAITLQLRPGGTATATYHQVAEALAAGEVTLARVREEVLKLRRNKSMVIDPGDPYTRSCGSFFENLTLTSAELAQLQAKAAAAGITETVPTFTEGTTVRVPTAWLIEKAGFPKGYRRGGVGVSARHNLALVNYEGTTQELLALVEMIQQAVRATFDLTLRPEPIIVA